MAVVASPAAWSERAVATGSSVGWARVTIPDGSSSTVFVADRFAQFPGPGGQYVDPDAVTQQANNLWLWPCHVAPNPPTAYTWPVPQNAAVFAYYDVKADYGYGPAVFFPPQLGDALQEAQAAVPAQQRVIIVFGTKLFRFFEALHCLLEAGEQAVREMAGAHLGLSAALEKDSQVIPTLVGVVQLLETLLRFLTMVRRIAGELVGDGQAEQETHRRDDREVQPRQRQSRL